MCLTGGSRCRLTWLCFAADEAWKPGVEGAGVWGWRRGCWIGLWVKDARHPTPPLAHPLISPLPPALNVTETEMKNRSTLFILPLRLEGLRSSCGISLVCPTAEELSVLKQLLSHEAVRLFFFSPSSDRLLYNSYRMHAAQGESSPNSAQTFCQGRAEGFFFFTCSELLIQPDFTQAVHLKKLPS